MPGVARRRGSGWDLVALCIALVGYWMAYLQSTSTLLLWARDFADRRIAGREIPISLFAALPWALAVGLTPPLLALFRGLGRRGRLPVAADKLRHGYVATAFGFAAVGVSSWLGAASVPCLLLAHRLPNVKR